MLVEDLGGAFQPKLESHCAVEPLGAGRLRHRFGGPELSGRIFGSLYRASGKRSSAFALPRVEQLRWVGAVLTCALVLTSCPVTAEATVLTNTTIASFGSFGAGACKGAAVGIAGYEAGQVVTAHPTGTVESGWDGRLQVTAVPGPAVDQVGYKVCNVGSSTVSSPAPQAILLASISADSGQLTAIVEKDFGSIAAHACASSPEPLLGAQTSAAVTAQPNGVIASQYGATGGLQVGAVPGAAPDQVTLKACNLTGDAINPPKQSFLLASFPATTSGTASNTSSLAYGQLAAGSCYSQTFGVPGATPTDAVIANPIAPIGAGFSDKLMVTGLSALSGNSNEGSYKVCNVGASAITPPAQNFRVMALHPPAPPCDPLLDAGCATTACDPVLDVACTNSCLVDPSAQGCSDPPPTTCGGRKATIVGTKRADTLKGTNRRDVIVGRGGRDVLIGAGGDDLICGGGGSDKLLGGKGDDTLLGGMGGDKLLGGPGVDRCGGGPGKDWAKGCEKVKKVP